MSRSPSMSQRARFAVLWQFVRPKAGILVFAMLLGILVSGGELASPLVARWILDSLAETGSSVMAPVGVLAGLLVVSALVGWWQAVILGSLAEDIVYDARAAMITRYLRARVLPLLSRSPGEWVTRVTSDSVLLREAASSSVIGIINGSVALTGTLVLMFFLDPVLTGVTIGVVAVVGAGVAILMPAISGIQEQAQAALSDLGGELDGTVRAIKTVKVATAEENQRTILLSHARRSRDHGIRVVRREALVWTATGAGIQAAVITVLALGAWRVSLEAITVSTLVAFLLYVFGLLGPASELAHHLTTLQAGVAAAGRIREVEALDTEDDSELPHPGTRYVADQHGAPPAIEIESVTASYRPGGTPAVSDLSLVFPSRGHTAIVGPSGAGKTTVMSLILRFLEPSTGRLRLLGVPYDELRPAAVRASITYVEQESPLLPGTLRHNLGFANPDVDGADMMRVVRELLLDDLVARLPQGLDTEVRDATISGGQRQRIAIARALLARPRILLLDEATAQVDGISESAIHDAIRNQAANGTVITIAHRLSTVVDADNIVVMDDGRISAQGSHEQLLASSPLYQRLVSTFTLSSRRATSPARCSDPAD